MSGSTSFGKKGNPAHDPTVVPDVSPVSSSDEIYVPTKAGESEDKSKKKLKKKKGAKDKAKTETDTAGSQASPLHLIQKALLLKPAQ